METVAVATLIGGPAEIIVADDNFNSLVEELLVAGPASRHRQPYFPQADFRPVSARSTSIGRA